MTWCLLYLVSGLVVTKDSYANTMDLQDKQWEPKKNKPSQIENTKHAANLSY